MDMFYECKGLWRLILEYLIWKVFCELCLVMKYFNDKGIIYEIFILIDCIFFDENGILKLDSGLLYLFFF